MASTDRATSRSELVQFTLETIKKELSITLVSPLGQGTFGDVYRMRDPDRRSDIAVKIVVPENAIDTESNLWPMLDHPNVLSLLEMLTLNPMGVVVFVTPLMESTLHDMLHEKTFVRSKGAFGKVQQWMYEVLCALEYIGDSGMCHLDVKVDNVLISRASVAVLCDFSFINKTDKPIERYCLGLPLIYRPPEVCQTLNEEVQVDGVSYDMWGFGLMCVEILTHFVIASNRRACENWLEDIYPLLFDALQEEEFKGLVTLAFPADVTDIDLNIALDFLHSFLWTDASKRPSPSFAKKHLFLNHGHETSYTRDDVWITKLKYYKIKTPISEPQSSSRTSTKSYSNDSQDTSDGIPEDSGSELPYSVRDIIEDLMNSVCDSSNDVSNSSTTDFPDISNLSLGETIPDIRRILRSPNTSDSSEGYYFPVGTISKDLRGTVSPASLGNSTDEVKRSIFLLKEINKANEIVTRRLTFPSDAKPKRNAHLSCPTLKFGSMENLSYAKTDFNPPGEILNNHQETVMLMSYEYGDTELIGDRCKDIALDKLLIFNESKETAVTNYSVSFEAEELGENNVTFNSHLKLTIHNGKIDTAKNVDKKFTTKEEKGLKDTSSLASINEAFFTGSDLSQLKENRFTEGPIKNNSLSIKETRMKFVSQSVPNLLSTKIRDTSKPSESSKISTSYPMELRNNNASSFSRNKLDGKNAKGTEMRLKVEASSAMKQPKKSLQSYLSKESFYNDTDKRRPKINVARKVINWFGRRCFPLRCGFKRSSGQHK